MQNTTCTRHNQWWRETACVDGWSLTVAGQSNAPPSAATLAELGEMLAVLTLIRRKRIEQGLDERTGAAS